MTINTVIHKEVCLKFLQVEVEAGQGQSAKGKGRHITARTGIRSKPQR